VPLANADYLEARLPNSRLDVLDTGHFAWEQAPAHYAAIVTAWINSGYLTGSAGLQHEPQPTPDSPSHNARSRTWRSITCLD
jgi:hypothetical protein